MSHRHDLIYINMIKGYALGLTKPISEAIDIWDDSGDHTTRLLKSLLIEFLCRMQDFRCLDKASAYFYSIPPEYFDLPTDTRYNNT